MPSSVVPLPHRGHEIVVPVVRYVRAKGAEEFFEDGRRDETELTVIADYLRDMYELAVQHVARLERPPDGP